MRYGLLLFTFLATAQCPRAQAARILSITPFTQSSLHGGISPTGVRCVAANMVYPFYLAGSNDSMFVGLMGGTNQVGTANHIFILRLQNISSNTQTATISLKSLTVRTSTSKDNTEAITSTPGVGITAPPTLTKNVLTIPTGQTKAWDFTIACSGTNCATGEGNYTEYAISGNPSIYPDIDSIRAKFCADPNHNCLAQSSTLELSVSIQEDKGAVQGSVDTWVHRCNGITDTLNGGVVSFQLNAGRPF